MCADSTGSWFICWDLHLVNRGNHFLSLPEPLPICTKLVLSPEFHTSLLILLPSAAFLPRAQHSRPGLQPVLLAGKQWQRQIDRAYSRKGSLQSRPGAKTWGRLGTTTAWGQMSGMVMETLTISWKEEKASSTSTSSYSEFLEIWKDHALSLQNPLRNSDSSWRYKSYCTAGGWFVAREVFSLVSGSRWWSHFSVAWAWLFSELGVPGTSFHTCL